MNVFTERAAVTIAVGMTLVLGVALVQRQGYSPDEEITMFAVESVRAHGVPVLPSGSTYWRGALYTYVAAGASALTRETLWTSRAVSVAAGIATVLLVGAISRRLLGGGALAALLIAVWPASVAIIGYARFYSPFVATYCLSVWALVRAAGGAWPLWPFVIAAAAARALHEFALSLPVLPLAYAAVVSDRGERRRFLAAGAASAAVVALTHLALLERLPGAGAAAATSARWGFNQYGLPSLVVDTLPLLQVARTGDLVAVAGLLAAAALATARRDAVDRLAAVAGALAAAVFALGVVIVVGVTWWFVRPTHLRRIAVTTGALVAAGWVAAVVVVAARTDVLINRTLALDLLASSVRFGWEGPRLFVTELPVLTALVVCGLAVAVFGRPRDRVAADLLRALAIVLWIYVVSLAFFGIDLRVRYFAVLTPLLAVSAASAVRWWPAGTQPSRFVLRASMITLAGALVVATVIEQERRAAAKVERVTGNVWWSWWAPTIGQASLDPATAPKVPDSDVVITNDELACLLRVGRIDYWLAPDATSLERFSLVTPRGRRGMYGGAVAILSADEIGRVVERASPRRVSVVLFRSGKFGFDPDRVYAVGPAIVIDRSAAEDWALVRLSSMTQTR